ncbi:MAG: ribosome maturation factor RimM [Dysgonamonadaceae bacterium]|jgi:16S rRNA processing protein RimM|nr:ribosome maturation factor RimM [Dysgonamonadaceae bacterium]
MIRREDLIKIGEFKKPHGIKGEISFSFTNDSFNKCERPFLFCELDGVFVPFLLEEYRFSSTSTALVKLKTIDSEQKARLLCLKEVYFLKEYITGFPSNKSFTWDYYIGFILIDKYKGKIGLILDVDESTINILFVVQKDGEEILIPATNEFITGIDEEQKTLYMELPEGLLYLKSAHKSYL